MTRHPWSRSGLACAFAGNGVAAGGVLAATIASTRVAGVRPQLPWATVTVAGLAFQLAVNTAFLASGRSALRRRARAYDAPLDAHKPAAVRVPDLVALAAGVRYHRTGCPLTAGKPVVTAARAAHERAGRAPCGVCLP